MRYDEMAGFIRERMGVVGIKTNRELMARMDRIGASTTEAMVSRWLVGRARPQGHRLEALLDVLGVLRKHEREAAERLAYLPPAREPAPGQVA
jgi:hypothetical protein